MLKLFTVFVAAYSIFQNGFCISEMNSLLRISSENAWKLNSILKHIWLSKNHSLATRL